MIPPEKSAAVSRGLREAFGVTACEEIHALNGTLAANPVFRIVVRGSAFLLRFNNRAGDLARQHACMKIAAEAGLAPRVWYASVEDRFSITDFVDAVPFPAADALHRIPAALRTLHAQPRFPEAPKHINTSCTYLLEQDIAQAGLIQMFRAANILPKEETEELIDCHARLAAVYPRDEADRVSSHNDLFKPDNMLFDGQRLWLVDWEAAFPNDRYADLAVAANLIVRNEAEERIYLQEYFGEPADEYRRARFFLMQQVAHLFYAMVVLLQGSAGQPIDWGESVPEFHEFHRRFWAGEVQLTDRRTKALYGRLHRERFLHNARQARYGEAVRLVSDHHAKT